MQILNKRLYRLRLYIKQYFLVIKYNLYITNPFLTKELNHNVLYVMGQKLIYKLCRLCWEALLKTRGRVFASSDVLLSSPLADRYQLTNPGQCVAFKINIKKILSYIIFPTANVMNSTIFPSISSILIPIKYVGIMRI